MNFKNCKFPYPILGYEDDIRTNVKLDDFETTLIADGRKLTVCANLPQIDNEDINELLERGYAKYFCEVDCTKTLFRKTYGSDTPTFEIELDSTDVDESLKLTFTIVATKRIEEYKNKDVNEMLKDITFTIEPGYVLAFFSAKTYALERARLNWRKQDDILLVRRMDNLLSINEVTYEIHREKIYVNLSSKAFDKYQRLAQSQQNAPLLISLLGVTPLTAALSVMWGPNHDGFDKVNDNYKWARFLKEMIDSDTRLRKIADNASGDQDMFVLAQAILNYPIYTAITKS